MQFPLYFGEIPNAFDDCIRDLSWLPAGSGYVALVLDAGMLLADDNVDPLGLLAGSLLDAASEFAVATAEQRATPFHTVLHTEPTAVAQLRSYWTATGVPKLAQID